jgi:beta-N-acetylhexosaminidase
LLTPEPTPIPLFRIGDTIAIRTAPIKDHNGHPVPDGTVVQFSMVLTGEGGGILQQVESVTTQGVARASFGLDKPGLLEIRAASEPAAISEVLQMDVSQSGAVAVTVVVPELTPSIEPPPEAVTEEETNAFITENGYPRFSAWLVSMLLLAAASLVSYAAALRIAQRRSAVRWGLGVLLGGLLAYNFLGFGLFGIADWMTGGSLVSVLGFVLFGGLLGLAGGFLWSRRP